MMHTIYRPGQWSTLVASGALVALPSDAPQTLVETLWDRLNAERTLAAVVDAITDSVGGSFSAMPPFVAVVMEGANARVAVRGDIAVDVTGADGEQSLSGADVMTWSERFIPGASRVVLRLEDASDAPALPVVGGVVRAAEVAADIEPTDGAADAQAGAAPADAVAAERAAVVGAAAGFTGVAQAPPPPPAAIAAEDVEAAVPADPSVDEVHDDADADAGNEDVIGTAAEETVAPEPQSTAVDPTEQGTATEPEVSEPGAAEAAASEPEVSEPEASEPGADASEPEPASSQDVSGETLVPTDQTLGSDFDEFQQLFGDTVHSAPSAPPAAPVEGDHDGATISVAEARALRGELPPVPQLEPEAPTALLPTVGSGRIRVSTGQVVALDRTVVIGRRPRAPRASGASLPHLIAVESPQQDISRSHLEIRPEGDTVVVIDLHTTNGSTLLRSGADPVRLHPGEQTLVLSGDVIDLGDGVTVTFEDLP
ncbi:FHA domain-containing protein [Microbacterium sp. NPDC056234]|uniref:FHA domain-containing protein n=1 Tax=Microbacterium sp. NPDC056234 TaxID=3345757 RepID=UPI0035DF6856